MLSIITITKNDLNGLRRTIESTRAIRSQDKDIEQLVIDGSDTDQALKNSELCQSQLKIHYLRREAHGISDAFNYGISTSKYKWLWFLNGGDQLNPSLDLAFFESFLTNVSADILIFQRVLMQKGIIVSFPPLQKSFPPVAPWIPHPGTLIRREIFARYGTFDPNYKIAMDYEFWLRLYGKNIVTNLISIPIALYDENGISSTHLSRVNYEGKEILKKYKGKLFILWLTMGKNIVNQYRAFKRSMNGN